MKKVAILFILFWLTVPAYSQTGISGTFKYPSGNSVDGTLSVQLLRQSVMNTCVSPSLIVPNTVVNFPVVNGIIGQPGNTFDLEDMDGNLWLVSIRIDGDLTTTSIGSGTAAAFDLNDNSGASWQLGVETDGHLTTTSITTGSYPTSFRLPSGWVLSVQTSGVLTDTSTTYPGLIPTDCMSAFVPYKAILTSNTGQQLFNEDWYVTTSGGAVIAPSSGVQLYSPVGLAPSLSSNPLAFVLPDNLAGFQTAPYKTLTVGGGSTSSVTVTWPRAFLTTYAVTCSAIDVASPYSPLAYVSSVNTATANNLNAVVTNTSGSSRSVELICRGRAGSLTGYGYEFYGQSNYGDGG